MHSVQLKDFVIQKSIRAETILGYEEMEVLGVSNKLGITVTDHKRSKDLAKYLLIEEGDFAYNPYRINVGSIGLTPRGKKGLVSPAYVVFTTTDKLIPELLLDFLKSPDGIHQIGKYARGTVRKALRFEELAQIELPVPPMDKQIEILSKRKCVEFEVDSVKSELTHQYTLLKKLRQQLLQEAIEGKLTADWRAQNPDVEPASELLKRIAAEKAQLVKDKKIKAQKPLPPITDKEKPFELPQGWEWCRIDDIIENKSHSLKAGPFGSSLTKDMYCSDGYKVYGQEQVIRQDPNYGGYYINREKYDELYSCKVSPGDILISLVGTIGKLLVLPARIESGVINPRLIKISLHKSIYAGYFDKLYSSNVVQKQLKDSASGQTMDVISIKILKSMRFPLPPVQEQQAIVTKVEKLLVICDQLEAQITQNQTHAEQLMQAVLKEAFSQTNEVALA